MLQPSDALAPSEGGRIGQSLYVYVDDLQSHLERARASGAAVSDPERFGDLTYEAQDLEGRSWTFALAHPTMRSVSLRSSYRS